MTTTLVFILALLLGLGLQTLGAALNSPPPGKTPLIMGAVVFFTGFLICLIFGLSGAGG